MNNEWRRVQTLFASGDVAEAARVAEKAVRNGPAPLAVHLLLIAAYLKLDRYRDAARTAAHAAKRPPAQPGELIELAKRLLYFNLSGALVDVAKRLLAGPVWHVGAEADLAALVSMVGEQTIASALLDRAARVAGINGAVLYNRSQMRLYRGQMAEAEADLRQALKLEPGVAKSHWALSKLPKASISDADIAAIQALAKGPLRDSPDEAFLQYALFNHLDRRDRVDEAWTALARACEVKRRSLSYDTGNSRVLFEALIARFPVGADLAPALPTTTGPTPIFVVGMHRSGTTLLERILGNHSEVTEAGELYDFPAQLRWAIGRHFNGPSDIAVVEAYDSIDFPALGQRYLDQVRWRANGKPFLVDKLPSNFINAGYLQRALPQAKILHMRRNAMDTCFSNLKELFSNACAYSYDQDELADYFSLYRRLTAHWQQALPGYVLDVSYEELTADPEGQARRILAFCGLDWQPGCLDVGSNTRAVNTASSAQVREPIHRRNVEAWRRYAPHLTRLQARLAKNGLI